MHGSRSENEDIRPLVRQLCFVGTIFASGNILDVRVERDPCLREREVVVFAPNLVPAFVGEPRRGRFSMASFELRKRQRGRLQFDWPAHLGICVHCPLLVGIPEGFPALQSRRVSYPTDLYRRGFVRCSLPKLRHLELIDVRLMNAETLVLPMFAPPKLNSIEVEIFSLNLTVYVFDPTYGRSYL